MSRKTRDATFLEGPSTHYLRFVVLKTSNVTVFDTRDIKYWVLGPSGFVYHNSEPVTMVVSAAQARWSSSPGTLVSLMGVVADAGGKD